MNYRTEYEIGQTVARERGTLLSSSDLALEVANRFDWNKYDVEGAEEAFIEAVMVAFQGYLSAMGIVNFTSALGQEQEGQEGE
jgi:hypothetical protein